jgi:hypothetical protein
MHIFSRAVAWVEKARRARRGGPKVKMESLTNKSKFEFRPKPIGILNVDEKALLIVGEVGIPAVMQEFGKSFKVRVDLLYNLTMTSNTHILRLAAITICF